MINEGISILNTNDFYEGVSIIEKYWNQDYGTLDIEGKNGIVTLELTTGGWSENEEIIDILCNTMFWFLWWQESKRGGYYKFIYSEKMGVEGNDKWTSNDKFKEQVIDLMAEYIEKVTVDLRVAFGENMLWNRNEIKQYFADLVEKE